MTTPRLITSKQVVELRADTPERLSVLEAYAEFWKIPYLSKAEETNSQSGVTFAAGHFEPGSDEPVIVSPTSVEDAERMAQRFGIELNIREESLIKLPFSKDASVSIRTRTYDFTGQGVEPIIKTGTSVVLSK